jgi:hypothetical protein
MLAKLHSSEAAGMMDQQLWFYLNWIPYAISSGITADIICIMLVKLAASIFCHFYDTTGSYHLT